MTQMFIQKNFEVDIEDGIFLHMAKTLPEPRTLKTHLPFSLFPKDLLENIKVIVFFLKKK